MFGKKKRLITVALSVLTLMSCRTESNAKKDSEVKEPVGTNQSTDHKEITTEIMLPQQMALSGTQNQAQQQDQGQVQNQTQQQVVPGITITGQCAEMRSGTSQDSYLLKFDLAQPGQTALNFINQAVIKIPVNCAKAQIKIANMDAAQAYQLFLQILVQYQKDGAIGPVLYHGLSQTFKPASQGIVITMKEGGLCKSNINIPDGPLYTISYVGADGKTRTARLSEPCQGGAIVYCTQEYAPVCGLPPSDPSQQGQLNVAPPKTYSNRCMLDGAKATFLFNGECDSKDYNCTTEVKPICGQIKEACAYPETCTKLIEKTFTNICELHKAKATALYEGTCKPK